MLHQAYSEVVYFSDRKLLCVWLVLGIPACWDILTANADSWSAAKRSVSLNIERSAEFVQMLCIANLPSLDEDPPISLV
jgi:hypothetical protein